MSSRLTNALIPALLVVALFASAAHASKGYSILYNFCQKGLPCADGATPGGLIADSSGNLFGTTAFGGLQTNSCLGCGTLYELAANGTETVIYAFCQQSNCTDGYDPNSPVVRDKSGNFYGTTLEGGSYGGGTVFKVTTSGVETVLYSFCMYCAPGSTPWAGVVLDDSGNIYGTARNEGSYNCGVVFELSPGGVETVLHAFGSINYDGCSPQAGLFRDKNGDLFGTTSAGGDHSGGTVFEITSSGTYSVLYSFCSQTSCKDGEYPEAGVVEDKAGNLYGTTYEGGANGYGTVFKLSSADTETALYSFCSQANCTDGKYPFTSVLIDGKNVYGTAAQGGDGGGVVFKLSHKKETLLHTFSGNGSDGYYATAPLTKFKGWFYSATKGGGSYGEGAVFKLGTKGDGTSR